MTRVTVLVSVWLLLVGSIADSAVSPGAHRSPLELLALYGAVTAAAVVALWTQLSGDPEPPDRGPPERDPWRYD